MQQKAHTWFFDQLSPELVACHSLKGIVLGRRTKYQTVEILETESFGRCLVLDGKPQSSEADEFIYHEALVHPAMLAHQNPQRVLIAGGGEGATLREVLGHKSVRLATMVDLDEEAVQLCREHLPQWHQGAFEDSRTHLVFADAREFLRTSKETYDVIISDITDPLEAGPAYLLYTKEFYSLVLERLSPHGLLVVQAGSTTLVSSHVFPAIAATIRSVFPMTACYHTYVPSFGAAWGFVVGSKAHNPASLSPEDIDRMLAQRLRRPLRFYDGVTHAGMFALPKNIRAILARETRIITDKEPLFSAFS